MRITIPVSALIIGSIGSVLACKSREPASELDEGFVSAFIDQQAVITKLQSLGVNLDKTELMACDTFRAELYGILPADTLRYQSKDDISEYKAKSSLLTIFAHEALLKRQSARPAHSAFKQAHAEIKAKGQEIAQAIDQGRLRRETLNEQQAIELEFHERDLSEDVFRVYQTMRLREESSMLNLLRDGAPMVKVAARALVSKFEKEEGPSTSMQNRLKVGEGMPTSMAFRYTPALETMLVTLARRETIDTHVTCLIGTVRQALAEMVGALSLYHFNFGMFLEGNAPYWRDRWLVSSVEAVFRGPSKWQDSDVVQMLKDLERHKAHILGELSAVSASLPQFRALLTQDPGSSVAPALNRWVEGDGARDLAAQPTAAKVIRFHIQELADLEAARIFLSRLGTSH